MLEAWGEMATIPDVSKALVMEEGMKFPDCNRERRKRIRLIPNLCCNSIPCSQVIFLNCSMSTKSNAVHSNCPSE